LWYLARRCKGLVEAVCSLALLVKLSLQAGGLLLQRAHGALNSIQTLAMLGNRRFEALELTMKRRQQYRNSPVAMTRGRLNLGVLYTILLYVVHSQIHPLDQRRD
jgi:hypothetical protein